MKLNKKELLSGVLAAIMGLGIAYSNDIEAATRNEIASIQVKSDKDFRYWNRNSAAFNQLTEYVKDVTDKNSRNFIPEEDRIAVFDCDGTLMCETAPFYFDWMLCLHRLEDDPGFKPTEEMLELSRGMHESVYNHTASDELDEIKNTKLFPILFAGMTPEAYQDYVARYMNSSYVTGLSNLKTGEAFYLPMAEVVSYLDRNDFTVYIVSGCERDTVRTLVNDIMPIEPNHIIGSDHSYHMMNQDEDVRADLYQYTKGDDLVRGSRLVGVNVKSSKVVLIHREIGKKPVLAFGNSSGDASMFDYTINDNKYKAAACVLLCDDVDRELGNPEKADKMKQTAQKHGWVTVSMRDDFKTIYGDNVKRTEK